MQPHHIVVPLTSNVPLFEAAVAFEAFGRARRDFPVPSARWVLGGGLTA